MESILGKRNKNLIKGKNANQLVQGWKNLVNPQIFINKIQEPAFLSSYLIFTIGI